MTEQAQSDEALAERLVEVAGDLLANGSDATAGLTALLRDIHERDPGALDRFHARITAARLGLRSGVATH